MAADPSASAGADVMIAGGAESMSMVPDGRQQTLVQPGGFAGTNVGIAYGMGLTAERCAQWKVSRGRRTPSHWPRAEGAQAMAAGEFTAEMTPVNRRALAEPGHRRVRQTRAGQPRRRRAPDTSLEALGKLKPVFAARAASPQGNSSQTSDGAGR